MASIYQEETKHTDIESRRNERKKRAQLRIEKIKERIKNENITLYKSSDVVKGRSNYDMWGNIIAYRLFDTNWKTPIHYDECNLCHTKVSTGFMNDHLNNVCGEQLIQCNLCNECIKRNKLMSHWSDGTQCNGYILSCSRCNNVFSDKNEYMKHQHNESYPEYGEETKCKWLFNTDNNDKYKQLFCKKEAIETWWICNKCHQRCDIGNEVNEHHCIDYSHYTNDKNINRVPLFIMRLTCKELVGQNLIVNLIRKEIEIFIPPEIKELINQYYSGRK